MYGPHGTAQAWYDANQGKWEQMGREAVGCNLTMILEKKGNMTRKFKGEIVEATPCGFRKRPRTVVVQFKIKIRNQTGTEREFTVSKLPRY